MLAFLAPGTSTGANVQDRRAETTGVPRAALPPKRATSPTLLSRPPSRERLRWHRLRAAARASEAASLVVAAAVAQRWIAMPKWAGVLGEVGPVPPEWAGPSAGSIPTKSGSVTEQRVAVAVERATRLLPFTPTCLAQATAGQVMLRRRGEPGSVVVGLQPPEGPGRVESAPHPPSGGLTRGSWAQQVR